MAKLIKLSEWAKINGYTYRGAFGLFKKGGIEGGIQLENKAIMVEVKTKTWICPNCHFELKESA